MPYDNIISRQDVQALIPEEVSNEILVNLQATSAAMTMFKPLTMPTSQTRMPVLAALPTAYFVNGDTGLKQTTEVDWANKFLNAEELAAIVPIPERVLADTNYDVWATIRPLLEQAIGRALDAAVFFGANKPASWPGAIVTDAISHSNAVTRGTASVAAGGIAQDLNNVMGTVEAGGFAPSGFVTTVTQRALLRGARDTFGQRLMDVGANGDTVMGLPIAYAMPGLWPTGSGAAEMITGDFTQGILATRQDIEYKLLTEAAIFDSNSNLIYNLPQQDMVALRVTARFGFQIANTINYQQITEASRYPFGVLQKP